jgi:hypothetical protein
MYWPGAADRGLTSLTATLRVARAGSLFVRQSCRQTDWISAAAAPEVVNVIFRGVLLSEVMRNTSL